jgi:hypothetical protein
MRTRLSFCVGFLGSAALLALAASVARAEPPTYTATDITGWTPAQLETLPFFKHWIPTLHTTPPAPIGFFAYARTADGAFAGAAPSERTLRVGPPRDSHRPGCLHLDRAVRLVLLVLLVVGRTRLSLLLGHRPRQHRLRHQPRRPRGGQGHTGGQRLQLDRRHVPRVHLRRRSGPRGSPSRRDTGRRDVHQQSRTDRRLRVGGASPTGRLPPGCFGTGDDARRDRRICVPAALDQRQWMDRRCVRPRPVCVTLRIRDHPAPEAGRLPAGRRPRHERLGLGRRVLRPVQRSRDLRHHLGAAPRRHVDRARPG